MAMLNYQMIFNIYIYIYMKGFHMFQAKMEMIHHGRCQDIGIHQQLEILRIGHYGKWIE